MIFVPVKKKFELHPYKKKNYLKKIPGPTSQLIWHVVRHVAVADCATLATWQVT